MKTPCLGVYVKYSIACTCIITSFFTPKVMAVDYLDFSTPDDVKMPPFQKIKEEFSKDLQSSVLFPDFTVRSTQNKGKHSHTACSWIITAITQCGLLIIQSTNILLLKWY